MEQKKTLVSREIDKVGVVSLRDEANKKET